MRPTWATNAKLATCRSRQCALAMRLAVHLDAGAAKIRPHYGPRAPRRGTRKRFLASYFVKHGRSIVLALQHSGNSKNIAISGCYSRLLDVTMNFWRLLCRCPAAVHDLLKLEEVKHCYDECIGGISRGAPLV